jgi:predicted alpha/beta-hydrolase family hydrolase
VDLKVYSSEKPVAALVLAHGAGGGQLSGFMVEAARGFAARRVTTATFDFPYMAARRKIPDRAPVLEQAWRDAVEAARSTFKRVPIFIGGKSMRRPNRHPRRGAEKHLPCRYQDTVGVRRFVDLLDSHAR